VVNGVPQRRSGRYGYGSGHGSYGYEPYGGYGDDESASMAAANVRRYWLPIGRKSVPDKENFGGLID
jgi:hypothetical protein